MAANNPTGMPDARPPAGGAKSATIPAHQAGRRFHHATGGVLPLLRQKHGRGHELLTGAGGGRERTHRYGT